MRAARVAVAVSLILAGPAIGAPIRVACVSESHNTFRFVFDLERKSVESDPVDPAYPCTLTAVSQATIAFACVYTVTMPSKKHLNSVYSLDRTTGVLEERESMTGTDTSGAPLKPTFHRFTSQCQKDEAKF